MGSSLFLSFHSFFVPYFFRAQGRDSCTYIRTMRQGEEFEIGPPTCHKPASVTIHHRYLRIIDSYRRHEFLLKTEPPFLQVSRLRNTGRPPFLSPPRVQIFPLFTVAGVPAFFFSFFPLSSSGSVLYRFVWTAFVQDAMK